MKALVIVLGVLILSIMVPITFMSMHDALTSDYTQVFGATTTGAGVTTANLTLAIELWNDAVSSVTSVSSNISPDIPTVQSYNATPRVLTVSGLNASDNRTLTVNYEYDAPHIASIQGGSVLLQVQIYFIVLGSLALMLGAIVLIFKGG